MHITKVLHILMVLVTLSDTLTASNFQTDFLRRVNNHRRKFGCPDLRLSNRLCKSAGEYAKFLSTNRDEDVPDGSSVCLTYDDPLSCVDNWFDEIKYYNFENGAYVYEAEDFTQMIWKSSVWFGVGKFISETDGEITVVAKYFPVGNLRGTFVNNVPNIYKNLSSSNLKPISCFSWIFSTIVLKLGVFKLFCLFE
ncbi:Golgi-associated plant pathogenesis-related protein 1-like [Drosophila grimshawi]|uniref:Golgi-associated plant pathogenesis-related protein 1-like n=1 Tax=Drosophila grimshawi TaxID=7222 RepID=UPI000C870A0B|nr:Golgi-associated plant pathogenesis-related protein 1-like [Drosophila grimshawi]